MHVVVLFFKKDMNVWLLVGLENFRVFLSKNFNKQYDKIHIKQRYYTWVIPSTTEPCWNAATGQPLSLAHLGLLGLLLSACTLVWHDWDAPGMTYQLHLTSCPATGLLLGQADLRCP